MLGIIERMRLFVGFLIPESQKEAIIELQSEIGTLDADCKNVERDNLHLSMSFLGETAEDDVERIEKDLKEISLKFKKFDVAISGTRAIPNQRIVRVIALDVFDDSGVLDRLLEEIRQKIGGDVKPPHLTLCRMKSARGKERILEFVGKHNSDSFGKIKISSIQLIESKLSRSGPVYSVVSGHPFQD